MEKEKRWVPIVAVAMVVASVAIAFLALGGPPAPVTAAPPAAEPSYQAADGPVRSHPTEAEQAATAQAPREATAPHPTPDDPAADPISASEQRTFKTRKALETIDPREFLRQGAAPPTQMPQ